MFTLAATGLILGDVQSFLGCLRSRFVSREQARSFSSSLKLRTPRRSAVEHALGVRKVKSSIPSRGSFSRFLLYFSIHMFGIRWLGHCELDLVDDH